MIALNTCDLCAERGISVLATNDMRTPGGMWANVCDACAYRLRSRLPLPAAVPDVDREYRVAQLTTAPWFREVPGVSAGLSTIRLAGES